MIIAAKTLLERGGFPSRHLDALIEAVRDHTVRETQVSQGRIESRRKRYKSAAPPLPAGGRPRMVLYLDESGTSVPFKPTAPEGHSVFALGGVAMTESASVAYQAAADDLKRRFFCDERVTLHEPYIRQASDEFGFGGDIDRQMEFRKAVGDLIAEADFVPFGVVIRKDGYQSEFLEQGLGAHLPFDVYSVAITMIIERFVDFLAHLDVRYLGALVFESQGSNQDVGHQYCYSSTLLHGTQYVSERVLYQWLEPGCQFVPKCGSHPVELADILSRDLSEWCRAGCEGSPGYWDKFSKKAYCRGTGTQGTFGFKVFPATGLEGAIYRHRAECGADLPDGLLES